MDSIELSKRIRIETLQMVQRAGASHVGGALSMADLLAVLYSRVLRIRPADPSWKERDRFILSKGHSCTALYATLALVGFFPVEELQTYGRDASRLMSHISHKVPGVEFSTGSLGHGLPFGCGKALAAERKGLDWKTFVMLSDGELDEGSNWEAILFAGHHKLRNLVVLVDYNKIQSLGGVEEVMGLHPLGEKFRAFRWDVCEIDGHDHGAILEALTKDPGGRTAPLCVLAHTVKGAGVSYMEGQLLWHYKSPSLEQVATAVREIEAGRGALS